MFKKCSKCGELKPLTQFYKDKSQKDGHLNYCKACYVIYRNSRINKDPDAFKERKKQINYKWMASHKEWRYRYNLKWFADHPEKARQYGIKTRLLIKNDPEKLKEYLKKIREYQRANRDKYRDKNRLRKKTYGLICRGVLIKQPCLVCGCINVQCHHLSYDDPLNVQWLCLKHHWEQHRKYINQD